jgi:hypothetical protein
MTKVVKAYPAGNDSRAAASERSAAAKQKELVRRGSPSGNASKHAGNMVARQSTGNPDGTPSY